MDDYTRHRRWFRFLYRLLHGWLCRKFNLTHEDIHVDGPILLIPNHSCAWDPLLVSMSLPDKHVYFVASEHIFRLGLVSEVLESVLAPIPRRKAASGADTVKACLRHLRAGHSVCLFAEGEQSWAGRSIPVFPATGKLVKHSGATLVTYRLDGAYLSLPRWAKSLRRGRIHGHPVGIYPPEQLRTMTPQEINELINRDIDIDVWTQQRMEPVAFRGRHRAEGLERAFYLCPRCCRVGTLKTHNNQVFCDCGLTLEYTETGFLRPEKPFATLEQWDNWQRQKLHGREFPHPGNGGPLFSDSGTVLVRVGTGHGETPLGTGDLVQYEDRLECAGYRFPLSEISNLALILSKRMLLTINGEYYEIRAKDVNFRKYLEVWKEQK